jgi:hypothetical protein
MVVLHVVRRNALVISGDVDDEWTSRSLPVDSEPVLDVDITPTGPESGVLTLRKDALVFARIVDIPALAFCHFVTDVESPFRLLPSKRPPLS